MKRKLAIVLLLCLVMAAQAQFSVSTNLGFSHSGYSYTQGGLPAYNSDLPQGWALDFAPRVGYTLPNGLSVGLDLGLGYSDYVHTNGFFNPNTDGWEKSEISDQTLFTLSAALFVRRQFMTWGPLTLHAELAAGYGLGRGTHTLTQYTVGGWGSLDEWQAIRDMHNNRLYLRLVPVLNYAFGQHFSIDAYLDFISLTFAHQVTTLYGTKNKPNQSGDVFSRTVTNDFDLGIRSLTAHLLTLGFSYHF